MIKEYQFFLIITFPKKNKSNKEGDKEATKLVIDLEFISHIIFMWRDINQIIIWELCFSRDKWFCKGENDDIRK